MVQKKAFFWFAYTLCLFGIFGIHRFYLFEAGVKRHWLIFYALALVAFASGIFGLWDQLLFTYFLALFFQIIDGILIKYNNCLDFESLVFNGMSNKPDDSVESTDVYRVSPEIDNSPSSMPPFQSALEQQNVPDSQVIKTEKENHLALNPDPTMEVSGQAQRILKILESKDKRWTLDEIYHELRISSDSGDSKSMTRKLLDSLHVDNYIVVKNEGKNIFFYLLNHSNLTHTNIDKNLDLIIERDSDRLAD
jgi:hypothetical protein